MPFRRSLLAILLLICFTRGFAATFVVTSNADSGPGTLRDALTQAAANGTSVKDYITFNLPDLSVNGRTITLVTQLPDVTGNLVIDGTTQPGTPFGVSNAKVAITAQLPLNTTIYLFWVDANATTSQTIEFYGLYLHGGNNEIQPAGIQNSNAKITLGAPGRGNVFSGLLSGIGGNLQNAVIQSNFFGIEPDGETPNQEQNEIGGTMDNALIGGPEQADGNVILSHNDNFAVFITGTGSGAPTTIQNNFFDTDYLAATAISFDSGVCIYASGQCNVSVLGNVFSANFGRVYGEQSASLIIKGNYFGTNKTQTANYTNNSSVNGYAVTVNSNASAVIGGTSPADQNVFANFYDVLIPNGGTMDVIQNTFYCNQIVQLPNTADNYIRILDIEDTKVSGDAPPGAVVQLYYVSQQCSDCDPKQWFANVTADVNGKWTYSGVIAPQSIMASSTLNGNTVGFQPPIIADDEYTVINKDCHHPASIVFKEPRTGRFQTILFNMSTSVATVLTPTTVIAPGYYELEITQGNSCPTAYSNPFMVLDLTPYAKGGSNYLECGNKTAIFSPPITTGTGITVTNYYWLDSGGNIVSNQYSPPLPAGTYTFYIKDSNGCTSAPVTVQVLPQPPPPVLDGSKAIVTDADCGKNDGSITNVTIQNIPPIGSYAGWFDITGKFITYGPDLTGVGPGTYYYSITYDSNCAPLITPNYTIGVKNGITMDESGAKPTQSSCGLATGSVTGIKVTGATQYQWTDASGNIVSYKPDLTNAPTGTYTLTASNADGCSKTSQPYTITALPATNYPVYPVSIVPTCSNASSGSITVTVDNLVAAFHWYDSQGSPAGLGSSIAGKPAGDYTLYLTDKNGCTSYYNKYTIGTISLITIQANSADIMNDQCNLKTGSITGIQASGGVPPYVYKWTDASGNTVSATIDLNNVGAGNYTLTVSDASSCEPATVIYPILNTDAVVPLPSVSNVQVCSSGSALVTVNNASATATYNLYTDVSSTTPAQQSLGGKFKVDVSGNTSFYITQLNGTCESSRAVVNISVGLSALNIPNTFTPNGDGINDYWQINSIENYPQALVQIFTRDGLKIFESRGYQVPFDGTYKGQKLPSGVYYFIINLNSNCSLLSGSLTLLR